MPIKQTLATSLTRLLACLLLIITNIGTICHSLAYSPKQAIVVVFGRPGSGKTTIAEKALSLLETKKDDNNVNVNCLGIDLDICIPQWMKDNFGKGIYPTLEERQDVAKVFCDYVETKCKEPANDATKNAATAAQAALVSFSFVNTDLRDIFRERFPNANWVLVDTSEDVANLRMEMRQGHFYSGKPTDDEEEGKGDEDETTDNNNNIKQEDEDEEAEAQDDDENSEWNFAPVDFPHDILDGNQSIEFNAETVSNVIRKAVANKLEASTKKDG